MKSSHWDLTDRLRPSAQLCRLASCLGVWYHGIYFQVMLNFGEPIG